MSDTTKDAAKPTPAEEAAAKPATDRPLPAPRSLTLAEREALRTRLQKKFH